MKRLSSSRSRSHFGFCLVIGATALLLNTHPSAHAHTWVQPNSGLWNDPLNWTPATVPDAVDETVTFESNQTSNRVVTYGEDITIGSITINNSTQFSNAIGVLNATTPVLTFDAPGAGPATITVTGNSTGTATPNNLNGAVVLNDNLTITVDPTLNTSVAGTLTLRQGTITGPGGITKEGTGTLTFADNDKAFTGPLIINAGRLRLNSTAANGSTNVTGTSSVTVNAGGQIALDGAGDFTFGPASPATVLTLNGTGPALIPGAIRSENNRITSLNNPIILQSSSAINVVGVCGSLTFSNTISGSGALTVGFSPGDPAASGVLLLSGNNSYSGGTTVSLGTLQVGGSPDASLGAGDVQLDSTATNLTIQMGVINAMADTATVTLAGGGTAGIADFGYLDLAAGVNETVAGLVLGTVAQGIGTFGSSLSTATFKNDEFFAGTGILTVIPEPCTPLMILGTLSTVVGLRRFRRRH